METMSLLFTTENSSFIYMAKSILSKLLYLSLKCHPVNSLAVAYTVLQTVRKYLCISNSVHGREILK